MLEFSIFKPFSERIIHGITTKDMGSFNDNESGFNEKYSELRAISPNPIFSRQMHGDGIIIIEKTPENIFEADSFITNKSGFTLVIKIADCQAILIYDPVKSVIAAAHAGWRGTALNIAGKTIRKMSDEFGSDPSDLFVGISPSLGPCCAQFSDPLNELPDFMHKFVKDRYVDLWSAAVKQLTDAGVPEDHIELYGECTKCNPDKYFSHRNGDTGRMAVFISVK